MINTQIRVRGNVKGVIATIKEKIDKAYVRIGQGIKQEARDGIGKTFKNHGKPGGFARSPTGILRDTIAYSYDPTTQILIVGPKSSQNPYTDFEDGKSIPHGLEYGGVVRHSKPVWKPAKYAGNKYKVAQVKRLREQGVKVQKSELLGVWIPAGSYRVAARPTMRLAFTKRLKRQSMRKYFDAVGVNAKSLLEDLTT